MRRENLFYLSVTGLALILSGCVVRTYPLTRDRIDQDLSTGNRGYLAGIGPVVSEDERKTTRTTKVIEIELRSPIKFEKSRKAKEIVQKEETAAEGNRGYITETQSPALEVSEPQLEAPVSYEKYTVQKGDTLQKISMHFYGTTKRWKKIFNANSGLLKTPDKVRAGQVLNIPSEGIKEIKENLK
jgi:nucleoid-associated protein YgaU